VRTVAFSLFSTDPAVLPIRPPWRLGVLGAIVALHAGAVAALHTARSDRLTAPETVAPMLIAQLAPAAITETPPAAPRQTPPPPVPPQPKPVPRPKPKPDTPRPVLPARPVTAPEPARPSDAEARPHLPATPAAADIPAETGAPSPPPVREPAAIACRVPPYPAEAKRQGKSGTVMLGLLIDETGTVTDWRIERTSGSEALDSAALAALSGCRFSPGTVDGRPRAAWARLRYVWKLN